MDISLFEVLGPVMIGPSSSHTAGAAKLARISAKIAKDDFYKVVFELHGSFANTGKGHGTDKALLAGAMGIHEDNERIQRAYAIARERKLEYEFRTADLSEYHENTVRITFYHEEGKISIIVGSSIGGGRILIHTINGMPARITAERPTLLIQQKDVKGVVNEISKVLVECGLNIGIMQLTRTEKGKIASTIIETDDPIPEVVRQRLSKYENILAVTIINAQE